MQGRLRRRVGRRQNDNKTTLCTLLCIGTTASYTTLTQHYTCMNAFLETIAYHLTHKNNYFAIFSNLQSVKILRKPSP